MVCPLYEYASGNELGRTLLKGTASVKSSRDRSRPVSESFDRLQAQGRLEEDLNQYPVRIGAVKGRAAVTMNFKRMDNRNSVGAKFRFQFFDSLNGFDDKSQVIKLPLFGGF